MLIWAINEFISDMMIIVPVSIVVVSLAVFTVVKFDIQPFADWLYKD